MAQNILSNLIPKLGVSSKRALVLGAGMVSKPAVQILSDNGIEVIVACRTLATAEKLTKDIANAKPLSLDASNAHELEEHVSKADVVISLVPYTLHASVIECAIKHKKNVVTTSYISPAIQALEQKVKDAGIVVMNEIGLDPGIDHLYAVKTITEVHEKGGKIDSFLSYCGGLPAPENSDNPLGYKFSWSSRGVLIALRNAAKFWKDGKVVDISGPELMGTAKPYYTGFAGYNFTAYANRDSTPYKDRYAIPEAKTILRGTLRYQGFPELIKALVDIGFLSEEPIDILEASKTVTWAEATAKMLRSSSTAENELIWAISSKTQFSDTREKERVIGGLRWIGLLSNEPATCRGNPLDSLCATLEQKMKYEDGERDFVFLQHKFGIIWNDSTESRTSTLVEYGSSISPSSTSAMAKLVGTPCAVATLMVLDGRLSTPGIHAPLTPDIAFPIMNELKEKYGIELKERVLPAEYKLE